MKKVYQNDKKAFNLIFIVLNWYIHQANLTPQTNKLESY